MAEVKHLARIIALWGFGGLSALLAGVILLERVAAERVEVVELHTVDTEGESVTTRLWVVDDEGYQYLRVGSDGSGWFSRLQENGEFELTRNAQRQRYRAVLREDKSGKINALMNEKYSWGDDVIAMLVGSREGSIPIELHALN